MATGDPKRVTPATGGMSGIADILNLLGGQKTTSNVSSDTGALQGVLGQLQASNDYDALLRSIFTQAGGEIPGLASRFSNAVGARSGNNSAVQSALSQLLESTALKGTDRVAQLQQQNLAQQGQVASQIAQGNRRQTTQQGTNLGQAGKALAILQAGSKLFGGGSGTDPLKDGKDLLSLAAPAAGDLSSFTSAAAPSFNAGFSPNVGGGGFNTGFLDSGVPASGFSFGDAAGGLGSGISDFASNFGGGLSDAASSIGSGISGAVGDIGSSLGDIGSGIGDFFGDIGDSIGSFFGFADGGLVGRDGEKEEEIQYPMGGKTRQPTNAPGTPQAYADGGRVEPKVGTMGPKKKGGTGGGLSDEAIRNAGSSGSGQDNKKEKYGVGALGANPLTQPGTIIEIRLKKAEEDAGFADGGEVGAGRESLVRSGGGRRSSAPSFTRDAVVRSSAIQSPLETLNPAVFRDALGISDPNKIYDPLDDAGGVGSSASNAGPTAASSAVGNAIGTVAANAVMGMALGPIGSAVAGMLGLGPTQSNAAAVAAAIDAIGSTGESGANAIGSIGDNAGSIGIGGPAGGIGSSVGNSGNVGIGGNAGIGGEGIGGIGIGDSGDGGSSGVGSAGSGSAGGGGASASAGSGGADGSGYRRGGEVDGPGTGTSDSINARLSDGEYIIPADVVEALGTNFFDALRANFHTPVAKQK